MYLGIDIGTSAVKAVLVDGAGAVKSEARAPLSVSRPQPLWSEQNPDDWWTAVNDAVMQLDAGLRRRVRAVGLSGQMHGAVLLDRDRQVLRPAILWNDGRCAAECEELLAREPRAHDLTGNPILPGFTAPKLAWVRKHEPEVWRRIDLVLLPKDYVRLLMTGEAATDLSDASGMLWVDVGRRRWSPEMLGATDLDVSNMARLVEGSDQTGVLSAEVAAAWGMDRVPVAGGGGDNAAGAVGVGVIADGDALLSLGTSGVIFVATDAFRPNVAGTVHAFCHALPGRWHQMSVMLNAASCLDFTAGLTGRGEVGAMLADLEASGLQDTPELFLPYLTGERTPHNDPLATGVFFGLTPSTDARALALATLEGVAMGLADGLEVLEDAGAKIDFINVIGGGSRSAFWGGILASAIGKTLVYRDGGEAGPSYGAARLARLCLGEDRVEEVCTAPPVSAVIEPDPALSDRLAAKRVRFKRLYQTLQPLFAG
jgi:xylulokinase